MTRPCGETTRSRFLKVLNGEMPNDRLPLMEWAMWWDLSQRRWEREGLPKGLDIAGLKRYFGTDMDHQSWFWAMGHGGVSKYGHSHWIENQRDYEELLPALYPDPPAYHGANWAEKSDEQAAGDAVIWISLRGFFAWPRVLFGIEPHLFAFYDNPDLMHRINDDLVDYNLRCIDFFCDNISVPDFMTFAEDMSYNHGPMISKQQFDEFMAPYYQRVIPRLKERGITPIIDSDGDVEPLISWFQSIGLEGILPLERMAGVDVNRIRAKHPKWKMVGGFDKTVMHRGEEAMRREFERILPAAQAGYFIPSVDHQTPPEVSINDYWLYLKLLREYMTKAVQG